MRFLIAILALLVLGRPACAEEVTITDGTGQEIAYWQDCQRIVSLMPNLTEMVAFLGYADKLVGKSSYCNYPDSILSVDDIGGQVDASLEKIVALQPDIVLAYQGNSLELVDQLRQLGIQVLALEEANTIADINDQMSLLDFVLCAPDEFHTETIDAWKKELFEFDYRMDRLDPRERQTVFFGYPGELVYTCGQQSFINDAMQLCDLRNVVELPDRWPAVSAEYIMASDPDWILTTTSCTEDEDPAEARSGMLAELRGDPVFRELRAVQQGQLIVVNSDHLLRPGPRILQALVEIREQLSNPVAGEVSNRGAASAP